jgi:allantoinase
MVDVVVRGGRLVLPEGIHDADLAVEGERIVQVGPELPGGREEIDARGRFVLPAVVDVHVHFNEPGRAEWEGAATGSRALAAGGGTVFVDMPLNSSPCTLTADAVDRKREALEAASITDFALWGGLVPGAVPEMAGMAARGVVGFKAFMCPSGLPEFPPADDRTLEAGMCEAARLGLPVAVHAESDVLVQPMADGSARDFLASRPVAAELDAIRRALAIAAETGASLHVVHVSSGQGVALAAEARSRGVDVSIETCPHYLCFTVEDVDRLGVVAKCAPPFRAAEEQARLWAEVLNGRVDIVASDHSPTEPRLKQGSFLTAWGGIAGVQSTLAVLLSCGHHDRGLSLERIAALLSASPARRFKLAGKGSLAIGGHADLALVALDEPFALEAGDLHQRHKVTPYLGRRFRGRVTHTIRRGDVIFNNGRITARTSGRFVRPG